MGNDRLFTAVLTTQGTEGDATVRTALDARTLEGMRVEIEHSDCGGRFDAPTRITDEGHVLVELLAEQQQAHGTGRYTMIVTGQIPAPEHHDGRRAVTLTTPLCEVVEATDTTTIEQGAPIDLHIAPLLRGERGEKGEPGTAAPAAPAELDPVAVVKALQQWSIGLIDAQMELEARKTVARGNVSAEFDETYNRMLAEGGEAADQGMAAWKAEQLHKTPKIHPINIDKLGTLEEYAGWLEPLDVAGRLGLVKILDPGDGYEFGRVAYHDPGKVRNEIINLRSEVEQLRAGMAQLGGGATSGNDSDDNGLADDTEELNALRMQVAQLERDRDTMGQMLQDLEQRFEQRGHELGTLQQMVHDLATRVAQQ